MSDLGRLCGHNSLDTACKGRHWTITCSESDCDLRIEEASSLIRIWLLVKVIYPILSKLDYSLLWIRCFIKEYHWVFSGLALIIVLFVITLATMILSILAAGGF